MVHGCGCIDDVLFDGIVVVADTLPLSDKTMLTFRRGIVWRRRLAAAVGDAVVA